MDLDISLEDLGLDEQDFDSIELSEVSITCETESFYSELSHQTVDSEASEDTLVKQRRAFNLAPRPAPFASPTNKRLPGKRKRRRAINEAQMIASFTGESMNDAAVEMRLFVLGSNFEKDAQKIDPSAFYAHDGIKFTGFDFSKKFETPKKSEKSPKAPEVFKISDKKVRHRINFLKSQEFYQNFVKFLKNYKENSENSLNILSLHAATSKRALYANPRLSNLCLPLRIVAANPLSRLLIHVAAYENGLTSKSEDFVREDGQISRESFVFVKSSDAPLKIRNDYKEFIIEAIREERSLPVSGFE